MGNYIFYLPGEGVKFTDAVNFIAKKFYPNGGFPSIGGENFHHVPMDPELVADKVNVVALVLYFH